MGAASPRGEMSPAAAGGGGPGGSGLASLAGSRAVRAARAGASGALGRAAAAARATRSDGRRWIGAVRRRARRPQGPGVGVGGFVVELAGYLKERRARVERALEEALPAKSPDPGRLVEAMRYTLFLPGKRLRAVICVAVAEAFGGRERDVMPLGVAVEMVHAASLILDDLPAFDDATLRRGAPANHRVFGEATAVLAAVSLLAAAFRHLGDRSRPRFFGPDDAVGAVRELADAVGENGMVAGEALDILARGGRPDLDELERIHALKTGSLFIACAGEAARLSGAGPLEQAALRAYAKNLGLAFQITDDLLDVVGDPAATGKDHAEASEGANFVAFAGVEGARRLAEELIETATSSLEPLGKRATTLAALAEFVGRRDR